MKRYIWLSLSILWVGFIFFNSTRTGADSSVSSGKLVEFASNILGLFNIKIPSNILSVIIRKGAHFFEFFLLAIFLYNYFKYFNIVKNSHKYYKNVSIYTFLIVLGICVMIAATDEFIQLFVENRVGSIIDVLIDTSGSIFGLGLIALLNYKKIKSSLNND